ncbi:MAG: dihydroorotase [Actinomycetaceae bacterium]|nr:dihydroorotase [Actinomycetaceae bacterium]
MAFDSVIFTALSIEGEQPTSLAVREGIIADRGNHIVAQPGDTVIDCHGWIGLPGLVDPHTHLREPGIEEAETVETGSRAAAAGGYTCVHAMANTRPVSDSVDIVEHVLDLGKQSGWVDVRPVGAVTKGLEGKELSDLVGMADSRARVRMFSDDGVCVSDSLLMRQALEIIKDFDGVIAQHAQDPRLTEQAQMNEGALAEELGLKGWPPAAEESIIARDVLFAKHFHSRVHICHLSTKGAVEIVRVAKQHGINVTAEATPHHLYLTQEKARARDPRFKVNPPLRTQADVEAVRDGLEDGTIDCIGTDHAPHPDTAKSCGWEQGAFGMTGLETALPIIIDTMVKTGRMDWHDVARVMSSTPARIGLVEDQGRPLEKGNPANICVIDPHAQRVVRASQHYSRSRNTPFEEMVLPGHVMYTMFHGRFSVREGQLVEGMSR